MGKKNKKNKKNKNNKTSPKTKDAPIPTQLQRRLTDPVNHKYWASAFSKAIKMPKLQYKEGLTEASMTISLNERHNKVTVVRKFKLEVKFQSEDCSSFQIYELIKNIHAPGKHIMQGGFGFEARGGNYPPARRRFTRALPPPCGGGGASPLWPEGWGTPLTRL